MKLEREERKRKKAKRAFLECLASTGNTSRSIEASGMSRYTIYEWRKSDEEFAKLWEAAEELALDAIEDALRARSIDGVEEYVISKGEIVYFDGVPLKRKTFSDSGAMFLLKSKRYREDKVELTGANGAPLAAPVPLNVVFVTPDPRDQEGRLVKRSDPMPAKTE